MKELELLTIEFNDFKNIVWLCLIITFIDILAVATLAFFVIRNGGIIKEARQAQLFFYNQAAQLLANQENFTKLFIEANQKLKDLDTDLQHLKAYIKVYEDRQRRGHLESQVMGFQNKGNSSNHININQPQEGLKSPIDNQAAFYAFLIEQIQKKKE